MKSICLSIVGTPTAAWRLPLQTTEGIDVRGWQIATVSQCSEIGGTGGDRMMVKTALLTLFRLRGAKAYYQLRVLLTRNGWFPQRSRIAIMQGNCGGRRDCGSGIDSYQGRRQAAELRNAGATLDTRAVVPIRSSRSEQWQMSIQFCQCPQLLPFSWLRPKAFLRKAPSPLYSPPRPFQPQADAVRHRQRVCHLFVRQQTAVINSI
jgi:hypothetical protein